MPALWTDYDLSHEELKAQVEDVLELLNKKLGRKKFKLVNDQFEADKYWIYIRDLEVEQAFIDTEGMDMYLANAAHDVRSSFSLYIFPEMFSKNRYAKDLSWGVSHAETLAFKILARIGSAIWEAYKDAIDTKKPFGPDMYTPEHVYDLYSKK